MRLFSLGLVALLLLAPLLGANSASSGSAVASSTGTAVTATSDIFSDVYPAVENGVSESIESDLGSAKPDSVFHVLPNGSTSLIFYFLAYRGTDWTEALPDAVDYSVSSAVNADSVTGYDETYVKGTLNKVGNTLRWVTPLGNYNCSAVKYRLDGVSFGTARRIMVRQFYRNLSGTETAVAVSTEYDFSADFTSYNPKVYKHVTVTDKDVGFFNVYDGDSNLGTLFSAQFKPEGKMFQEHYIAFNLDTPMENIIDIDIQTHWEKMWGETNIFGSGNELNAERAVNYKEEMMGLSKDSFKNNGTDRSSGFKDVTTDFEGRPLYQSFHVNHLKKSFRDTFYGQTISNVYYDSIMDLQNESGTLNTVKQFFGIQTYSSLFKGSSVCGADGKAKFKWFVNYAENEIQAYKLSYGVGDTNNESWFHVVKSDYPFMLGLDTSVISVDYVDLLGQKVSAVVVDVPKDEDPSAKSVFNSDGYTPGQKTPASNLGTLPEWAKILIALALACVAVSVLDLFFPVIKVIFKGIGIGVSFFFKLLVEIPYLLLVYPWLALIRGIKKEDPPKFWIFDGDSSGGNS